LVTIAVLVADITDVVTRSFGSSVTPEGAVAAAELWTDAGSVAVVGVVVVVKSVGGVEAVLKAIVEIVVANRSEPVSNSPCKMFSYALWCGAWQLGMRSTHECSWRYLVEELGLQMLRS